MTNAIQTMAALINESGGVLGRKIEIVSRDDESTPAVGVSRATELMSLGVSVIIEGWNSPVTLAMQPVIARGADLAQLRLEFVGCERVHNAISIPSSATSQPAAVTCARSGDPSIRIGLVLLIFFKM